MPTPPRLPLNRQCPSCGYRFDATTTECPVDGITLSKEKPGVERMGPYRLIERLGTGGMGAVYRAVHEKVGRAVAVKLLHRRLKNEAGPVARFFHEARAVNTVRHPNVVEIHDLQGEGDDIYMVMELLKGKDLRTVQEEAPAYRLPVERVVHLLEQVCGALQAVHGHNIVHRDLKPENIFVIDKPGHPDFVKLLDFGVAKLERPEGRLTREGVTLGTPEYMAPEQARGAAVDARSDVYSVGCIAYELLTGRTVFHGDNPSDVMIKQVTEAPPAPRKFNPDIPEALETVILRCLAKSPGGRPQSALDLAQELCKSINAPFDLSGAFMSWKSWDGPSSVSGIMEGAEPTTSTAIRIGSHASRSSMSHAKATKHRKLILGAATGVAVVLGVMAVLLRPKPVAVLPAAPPPTAAGPDVTAIARVLVQSQPPGARASSRARTLGITPFELRLPLGTELTVRLERDGYKPSESKLSVETNPSTFAVALEPLVPAKVPPPSTPTRAAVAQVARPTQPAPAPRQGRGGARVPAARIDSTARTINPF